MPSSSSALCCRSGVTYSDSIRVPVPPDVLWQTVADLPDLPNVVQMVTGFEWITNKSNCNNNVGGVSVGARFREIRQHKGREFVLVKTVTRLQDDPSGGKERFLSLGISYSDGASKRATDIENTSSLFVQSVPDSDKESLLILTIALGWGRWMDYLNDILCRVCIRSMVLRYNRQELEDYRRAAMQRYKDMNTEVATQTISESTSGTKRVESL